MFKRQLNPSGNEFLTGIQDSVVEDLLGRRLAHLDRRAISARLSGKGVLVTGAAGSVGSEICRQVAQYDPATIVGIDSAETPLFHLDREMRRGFPGVDFCPELGNIRDSRRLNEIVDRYRPLMFYHAAAYKHVRMAEAHVFEAVENNVLGTHHVLAAAAAHGAEDFVLLSSDKAVAPTSIMGATKRLAELLVLSTRVPCKCVSVRFGNVLGSSGSVLPIFLEQIENGGPVTVTDPEMQRYFMTAAEAAHLVLQAAVMGRGGETFLLDMGRPVKILDLARKLIRLCGLRPDEDIRIQFTGVGAGEKLYEDTHFDHEEILPTSHDNIKIFAGQGLSPERMAEHVAVLRQVCQERDLSGLMSSLRELVPDYQPSADVLRRAGLGGRRTAASASASL
jgi:FlaA1/EpsC-like NDP-sugar epimerase